MAAGGEREERSKHVRRRTKKRSREAVATADSEQVTDERFAAMHWDPRFSRVPKRASRLEIDDRFKTELKLNENFRGSRAPVDRFGRPKNTVEKDVALQHFYDLDDSEDDFVGDKGEQGCSKKSNSSFQPKDEDSSDHCSVRGENSSEHSDVDSGIGSHHLPNNASHIPRGDATNRLAVIGLDWSGTRAVDLFVSLHSFCPPGKHLREVRVHPSKFGMQRLTQEARLGPNILSKEDSEFVRKALLMPSDSAKVTARRNSDEHDDNLPSANAVDDNASDVNDEGSSDSESDDNGGKLELASASDSRKFEEQQKIRKYEEERLRYYYAVAEFEDVKTAEAVYDQCDGVELEASGLAMDLRFIPDDMVIDVPVRDSASRIPENYVPPQVMQSTLMSSTVKLSWDADAPDRAILKKKRFSRHEEDEENLKAYLASESDDDSHGGDDSNISDKLEDKRRLLLGGGEENHEADAAGMEMEVSFNPDLFEKGEEILKHNELRRNQESETEWQARLRRMRERKSEKRRARRQGGSQRPATADVENVGGLNSESEEAEAEAEDEDDMSAASQEGDEGDLQYFGPRRSISKKQAELPVAPGVASRRGKNRKVDSEAQKDDTLDQGEESRLAELELAMMSDHRKRRSDGKFSLRDRLMEADSDDDDGNMGDSKTRTKKRRGRRRREREAGEGGTSSEQIGGSKDEHSAMDVTDERFGGLFSSHLYALDPTHPKFKRNQTTDMILAEKVKRNNVENVAADERGEKPPSGIPASSHLANNRDDLMQLVASVKAKSTSTHRR